MVGGLDPIYGAALLDAYGPLLTERQREACALVFDEDWSLSEAAGALGVSRARAGALVGEAAHRLLSLEARLHLVARQGARLSLLQELGSLTEEGASPATLRDILARWRQIEDGWQEDGGPRAEPIMRSEGADADV
jgi:hypothetical protein